MTVLDSKPESLMVGLSVSSLVILFIIVIFTFLGGQLEAKARNATRPSKWPEKSRATWR